MSTSPCEPGPCALRSAAASIERGAGEALQRPLVKPLVRQQSFGGSPLVRAYLAGEPNALSFYAGPPYELATFRRKLGELNRRFGPKERELAASALKPASSSGKERLARFVTEGGAMVTTGQQAGFLTGPLYTIHKAASAVALAEHLEHKLGILVLPVFWVASEDHDWGEVNSTVLLDHRGRLRRVELESTDPRPLPMSDRAIEGDLDELLPHIAQTVGATRYNSDYIERILDLYRTPGASVAGAFGEAIELLFSGTDLMLADATDPAIKSASLDVLKGAMVDAEEHEGRLERRTKELEKSGYGPQVKVLGDGTNVFYRMDSGRHRLYRQGSDFVVRERRETLAREDLLTKLAAEPELFSPNVLLRPVVESAAFPTLAYVGGPSEIAYLAQASTLFEAYGMLPPVAVPRFSALVIEPGVERLLDDLEVTIDEIRRPRDELVEQLAQREVPKPLGGALRLLRENLAADFERLIEEARELDPTLDGALGSIRNSELAWAGRAERKIVRAIKRSERISLDQLDRLLNSLWPNGRAQERVLNILPYLGRYGRHFLRELERSIRDHWRLPDGS
ncbi:MAG: bacillithiol biosynthesis cysteine-adding enzyme BshC [Gemmatimonas sp.]|nr:bacillithiol biosynthesis cysteine-adding enzyme BshC [Gemmatimonas sp.]